MAGGVFGDETALARALSPPKCLALCNVETGDFCTGYFDKSPEKNYVGGDFDGIHNCRSQRIEVNVRPAQNMPKKPTFGPNIRLFAPNLTILPAFFVFLLGPRYEVL